MNKIDRITILKLKLKLYQDGGPGFLLTLERQ